VSGVLEKVQWTVSAANGRSPGGGAVLRNIDGERRARTEGWAGSARPVGMGELRLGNDPGDHFRSERAKRRTRALPGGAGRGEFAEDSRLAEGALVYRWLQVFGKQLQYSFPCR